MRFVDWNRVLSPKKFEWLAFHLEWYSIVWKVSTTFSVKGYDMASSSRSSRLQQLYQVLQKRYQPCSIGDRSVLEHLLYAICLNGASPSVAEQTLDTLIHAFYDFNEARVSSQRELSECLSQLSSPQDAASCIKGVLQTLFEATYSFDLESLRKMDMAEVYEQLKKYPGLSNFVVAYTMQVVLRQNAIPISEKTFHLLECLGMVHAEDAVLGTLPAVERAFSKTTAAEFTLLLHQLGLEYAEHPESEELRKLLVEIFPSAEHTLPRPTLKAKEKPAKSEKKPRGAKVDLPEETPKADGQGLAAKKGNTPEAGTSGEKTSGPEQTSKAAESVPGSRLPSSPGTKRPLSSKPLAARLAAVKTASKRTVSVNPSSEILETQGLVSARKVRSCEVAEEVKKVSEGKRASGKTTRKASTSDQSQRKEPPPKKADKAASTKHAVRGVSEEKKSTVAEIKKKPR